MFHFSNCIAFLQPMTVTAVQDCGRLHLLRWQNRIPPRNGCLSLVSDLCCHVEVLTLCRPLVQMNPTKCGVSGCDRKALTMRKCWPTQGCWAVGKKCFVSIMFQLLYIAKDSQYLETITQNSVARATWEPESLQSSLRYTTFCLQWHWNILWWRLRVPFPSIDIIDML
jgi:hypothetical protein